MTEPDDVIAAARRGAAGQASVGLDRIAVIAALLGLDHAVTAARRSAGDAGVGRIVVAVIAALTRADHAITATGC